MYGGTSEHLHATPRRQCICLKHTLSFHACCYVSVLHASFISVVVQRQSYHFCVHVTGATAYIFAELPFCMSVESSYVSHNLLWKRQSYDFCVQNTGAKWQVPSVMLSPVWWQAAQTL